MTYAQDEIYLICHNLVLKELTIDRRSCNSDKDTKRKKDITYVPVVTHVDRGPLGHCWYATRCERACCKLAVHDCVIRHAWCSACARLSQPQAGPNARSGLHL